MPSEYWPIFVLQIIALGFAALIIAIPYIFRTRHRGPIIPYESGITPIQDARRRFPVKFYLVAMLFIVFDIEAAFLYPWAVTFRQLPGYMLVEMAVFIAILLVGYVYIVKRGALEWE